MMRLINFKRAIIASIIIWVIGVMGYVGSFYIPLMENIEAQANLVLSIVLIIGGVYGAKFYYQKNDKTNGLLLGGFMFMITIIMDASITVPLFILPYGGNYASFFLDPFFWILGFEYVAVISLYALVKK